MSTRLHVAAAAIFDARGRVLVSRRPGHVHQGGLWEFPGGKLESGEDVGAGLQRELYEELGITMQSARPLIRVRHDYPDKAVLLDVWRVDVFDGEPSGREGQAMEWVEIGDLRDYRFPVANEPIIKAVQLPDRYLITPEPYPGFLAKLEQVLAGGISLVQLRAKAMSPADYRALVPEVLSVCRAANARLFLNADPQLAQELDADGVSLSSARLMALTERPVDLKLVAGSCHTQAEVEHACALGLDFVAVSPVQETRSHPGAVVLGFDGLRALTELATVPVYALGGMGEADLDTAFRHGAQGIAALSGLWR
jgi:8-oxo-dGTP diphosphatase